MKERVDAMEKRTAKTPRRKARKTGARRSTATPVLLTGGNPQIAKADGDAPVQAYITAMPGWKRDVGHRLDALVGRNVPGVRRAVRWNSPFQRQSAARSVESFECRAIVPLSRSCCASSMLCCSCPS